MKILTTFRNNWKKSVVSIVAVGYGIDTLKTKYEISNHMRHLSNEVLHYSSNSKNTSPKRVLVILNPVANNKKAEQKFQKYCEPLLHLAGYYVDIVKTNYVGHAKTYIESLKTLPEALVVAGGDGTSSEVVTGLMRRDEPPCPIALLPLGAQNESSLKYMNLTPKSDLEYVKCLSEALLPMIQERLRSENVIKFDVVETNDNAQNTKPIYGLSRFSWGILRDIDSIKDKYWYFGSLRHHAAAFFNLYSNSLNWKFSTNFIYTPPCAGCRNCSYVNNNSTASLAKTKFFWRRHQATKAVNEPPVFNIENKHCNTSVEGNIEANQLSIACRRNESEFFELETKCITSLNPGIDLVKNIPDMIQNNIEPSLTLKSRTIQLNPTSELSENTYYSIDGEEYDVRPIKISIIPNAVKVFC